MYELFEHTADLGLRVTADDLDTLFDEAARGLFAIIVANPDQIVVQRTVPFHVDGDDPAYLLFDWLGELLAAFDAQQLLFAEFDVRITSAGVDATARGEHFDAERHRLDHEIKAITYHGLTVQQAGDGWLAEVIVDI